jgi:hypothetical protein
VHYFSSNPSNIRTMPTFLQAVILPEWCFLYEVLYWVAFQRLPVASYTLDAEEFRLSDEVEDYEAEITDSPHLISEDETKFAGIPRDPKWVDWIEERSLLPASEYEKVLAGRVLEGDEVFKREMMEARDAALQLEKQCREWEPHYRRAIEYPASRIFVALKGGQLKAKGKLLPALDRDEARAVLDAEGRYLNDITPADIPAHFWSLQGTDFEASAAKSETAHYYCHIMVQTNELVSLFPGEREEVVGVERVGDNFVINDRVRKLPPSPRRRGRPAYPWEPFHLEVAGLLQGGELPSKKEAAIKHFQTWFRSHLGIEPSRAAIGEKLKPYYDKFGAREGQKTSK